MPATATVTETSIDNQTEPMTLIQTLKMNKSTITTTCSIDQAATTTTASTTTKATKESASERPILTKKHSAEEMKILSEYIRLGKRENINTSQRIWLFLFDSRCNT